MLEKDNADSQSNKLYDLSHIYKMCHNNQESIVRLLKVFISQMEQSIEEIKMADKTKNLDAIKKTIHKIKPMLTYYGTVQLHNEIQIMEEMVDKDHEKIELPLKRIEILSLRIIEKMRIEFKIIDK